jgi:hypothetical protein
MLRGYCRGQPRGSPKKPGESCLKPTKMQNTNTPRTQHKTYAHSTAHAAMAPAAHQSGPTRHPLERGLPRSRAHPPPPRAGPPRSRVPASLEGAPPRSRLPHERTCSRTRVRAFNALTQQSHAITRLGITPRRCSADSLGGAHPRHCGGLCDEASVSSVTLCRPLLYG